MRGEGESGVPIKLSSLSRGMDQHSLAHLVSKSSRSFCRDTISFRNAL